MRWVGFEQPEQLGALFIGDAYYLKGLVANSRPLVDNYPKLIEAVSESKEEVKRLLGSFSDVTAAEERFRNSPLIRRLWPERLLTSSLPYFEFQGMINADLYGGNLLQRPAVIEDAHRLLTRSSLSAPVLWRLGSDWDIQRIVTSAKDEELVHPTTQFQLGVRLISERNYAAAVEPLRRAAQLAQLREGAFRLHIFALCMSGQTGQAQYLVEERLAQTIGERGSAAAGSLKEASVLSFCR